MRKVKWLFFAYLASVLLAIVAIAVAFTAAPARDPDTYYTSYGAAVKTLDPAESDDTEGSDLLGYVCEALYNYKYGAVPYQLYPELASAMPTYSADNLTMTVPIRHGIHYYDPEKVIWPDGVGPEITAEDFVYSFKRVCDYNLASPNYSFVFQDHFAGLDDWWEYTKSHPGQVDYDRPTEGFTAAGKYTLQLKFSHAYPQMIYNMVNNPCSPVCRQIAEFWKDQVRLHPVGSGPYAMTKNLRDQQIVFKANPHYRGRPDVDGDAKLTDAERYPKIKTVQLDYFQEDMPVWIMLQQGLFDKGGIPKDSYSSAVTAGGDLTPEMIKKGIVLMKYSEPTIEYIGINFNDPVLGKNKPLRQAMSVGFDREAFIRKFLNGRGIPAIGALPPGFPTYDEHRINPNTVFNLKHAKELMTEAVKINGGPIPRLSMLLRSTDTTQRQEGDFYTEQFERIGIKLDLEYVDFARYQEKVDNRQTQLFDAGWSSDYPDEQDFLQLFYGKNAPPGMLNGGAWINKDFDRWYDESAPLPQSDKRTELYMKMEKLVEDECPWIMLYYPKVFSLQYDWLLNRTPMDYGHGYPQFYEMDKALRNKRLSPTH